jgi:hypothetical protein
MLQSKIMLMNEIRRVFFHELGHFVAREINHLFYGGTNTKSITICPHKDFQHLFVGELKVNIDNDGKGAKVASLEELPAYLASSTYGCFFQSYYLNTPLKKCFQENGEDDMQMWLKSLLANGLDWLNSDITVYDEEYFNLLKAGKELDEILHLNPDKYLIDNGDKSYNVDVELLRQDTVEFIQKHYLLYKTLTDKYGQILNGHEEG